MKETKNLHEIQMGILRALLFQPDARFRDLNARGVSNDHFTFHLKRLQELGLVEKMGKQYRLTPTGKEFANRFDADSSESRIVLEKQAKIGVLIGCVRGKEERREYLIQQRLKEPFYGYYGFMTGKVKWGEEIRETAARELQEETGLTADLSLMGIKHKMDYDKKGNLLEDKYFFIFRGDNPEGKLVESFEGGKNLWLGKEEIRKLPDLFDGVGETMRILESDELEFVEKKYTVSRY